MHRNGLFAGNGLFGFLIGFKVRSNGITGRSLYRFDVFPVGRNGQVGHLDSESGFGLLEHDQESHIVRR